MEVTNIIEQILSHHYFKLILKDLIQRVIFEKQSSNFNSQQSTNIKNVMTDISDSLITLIQVNAMNQMSIVYSEMVAKFQQLWVSLQFRIKNTFPTQIETSSSIQLNNLFKSSNKIKQAFEQRKKTTKILLNNHQQQKTSNNSDSITLSQKIEQLLIRINKLQKNQQISINKYQKIYQFKIQNNNNDIKKLKQKFMDLQLKLQEKIDQGFKGIWNIITLIEQKLQTKINLKQAKNNKLQLKISK